MPNKLQVLAFFRCNLKKFIQLMSELLHGPSCGSDRHHSFFLQIQQSLMIMVACIYYPSTYWIYLSDLVNSGWNHDTFYRFRYRRHIRPLLACLNPELLCQSGEGAPPFILHSDPLNSIKSAGLGCMAAKTRSNYSITLHASGGTPKIQSCFSEFHVQLSHR